MGSLRSVGVGSGFSQPQFGCWFWLSSTRIHGSNPIRLRDVRPAGEAPLRWAVRVSSLAQPGGGRELGESVWNARWVDGGLVPHMGVGQNYTARVTQVLVYFSVCQGSILDTYF